MFFHGSKCQEAEAIKLCRVQSLLCLGSHGDGFKARVHATMDTEILKKNMESILFY